MATITIEWGLIKTVEASAAYGARAIYTRDYGSLGGFGRPGVRVNVDVVWDRQSIAGDEPAKRALAQWLARKTGGGMTLLAKRLKAEGVLPSEDREIAIDHGRFHLRANPRKSYGYLYITAWMDAEPAASEVSR
jgi:hypothetical protein